MTRAVRLHARSISAIVSATALGFAAFLWPFWVAPGRFGSTYTPTG